MQDTGKGGVGRGSDLGKIGKDTVVAIVTNGTDTDSWVPGHQNEQYQDSTEQVTLFHKWNFEELVCVG